MVLSLGFAILAPANVGAAELDCTIVDDFDRTDSTDPGPLWNEVTVDMAIEGNLAVNGPLAGGGEGLMTFVPAEAEAACITAGSDGSTSVRYVALVLRYEGIDDNVFVKVQNHALFGVSYDTAFFYVGNNGEPFSDSVALTPFAAADLELRATGGKVELLIDVNFDGTADQIVTAASSPPPLKGATAGLGMTGAGATADSFGIVPRPPATKMTKKPPTRLKTGKGKKRLAFKFSSEAPVHTFSCTFDASKPKPCTSPYARKAGVGEHRFTVRAVDGLGNRDPTPAKGYVKIERK